MSCGRVRKKEGPAQTLRRADRYCRRCAPAPKIIVVAATPKTRTPRRSQQPQPFPIVGIGASAGGLEAFTQLLKHLPADMGMGLVLVQHLDPTHESELTRLLARGTSMPTHEVTDKMRVEPNHVYVIPPNMNMSIARGVLKLEPRREGRRPQHAIDFFFESLAADQRERAIGVVLSGTATDGTLGLEAIKAEGGITFAQDDSAKYDSMPRSAVAAGCVDFVLSPQNMARELARIAAHPYVIGLPGAAATAAASEEAPRDAGERERETATAHQDDATALPSGGHGAPAVGARRARSEAQRDEPRPGDDGFKKILLLLRSHCGVDFSLYKSTTIQRRIARRMVLGRHGSFADYAKFLREHSEELDTLFSDVLISVTSFFRNPEAFDVLKRLVFPKIVERRRDDSVRVWVLGCSTGQEAYSVAMAFSEFADKVPRAPALQIFATDLNDALLDKARAGLYAKTLAADISPERLRRFFVEEAGGYRVVKSLREGVVFARQNLISDPPFSRMDLVCCRNLLIYLEPALQKKALPTFHYALRPEGFLFLGASESLGQFTNLFEPVDKKQKIFAKKAVASPALHLAATLPRAGDKTQRAAPLPRALPEGLHTELSAQREADRLMVNEFAPPGVIVNAELQVIQFRGPTSAYLTPPRGKASFDVLKMAREGLMLPLRAAINKAKKEGKAVRKDNVRVLEEGNARLIDIQVIPLEKLKERCHLILFEKVPPAPVKTGETSGAHRPGRGAAASKAAREAAAAVDAQARGGSERPNVKALRLRLAESERELAESRDYLQMVEEQQDAANEELQAANEESQSANEELQSINEELETSKEELESTNEELTTINDEMANRNAELNRLNADLSNLNVSIHTAILVLGRDLTIRRFTPLAERAFNLLATDVGRPLSGIRHNLMMPPGPAPTGAGAALPLPLDLENLIREVIDTVGVREREVQDRQGRWYSLRVRPYLTLDNKIDGAVLALVDIDALKRSELDTEVARDSAEAIIRTVRDPLVVLYGDLRVKTASEAFYETFKIDPAASEGRLIYDLGNGQWNIPALRTLLEEVLASNHYFNDFEVTHDFQGLGLRTMLLNGRRLDGANGVPDSILLAIEDITERNRIEKDLREAGDRFRLMAETIPQKIFTARPNGDVDYFNPQWMAYSGLSFEAIRDWGWTQFIHRDDLAETVRVWKHSIDTGEPFHFDHRFRRADGEYRWHVSRAVALKDAAGETVMWAGSNSDIHDVKESDRRKDEFLALLAHELRNPLAPISNALHILRRTGAGRDADKPAIEMMQRQVAQMVRLVDDLLDVGRISRGKMALRLERIELASALHKALESARPHIEAMDQELTVTLSPQPIYLNADEARLTQVVGNLLSNASKFTERGGRIQLTAQRDDGQAVIRVQDSGIGIAADQLQRIFEMFTQVDTSIGRMQMGLGIGLTLVERLVELHGGTIEAHSRGIGKGAEFVVRLPALAESSPAAPVSPGSERAATLGRRVLVVDDNLDSAISMATLLELGGHEVHVAHDGIEAVQAAEKLQPDVILLDIGLPKIDGYEAARRIRRQQEGKGPMLIALTGWGQEEDRRRSLEAGFDYHLIKPADLSTLEKLLDMLPAP